MNKIIVTILLFLILAIPISASWSGRDVISNYTFNNGDYFKKTGVVYTSLLSNTRAGYDPYSDVYCWAKFSYGLDSIGNNITSRWILLDSYNPDKLDELLSDALSTVTYIPPPNTKSYALAYIVDTPYTYSRVDTLCPGSNQLMVTFYGGWSDSWYSNPHVSIGFLQPISNVVKEIRDQMNNSDIGKSYICLDYTNYTGSVLYMNSPTMGPFYFSDQNLLGVNVTPMVNVSTTSLAIGTTCEGLASSYIQSEPQTIDEMGIGRVRHKYLEPLAGDISTQNILDTIKYFHYSVIYIQIPGTDWVNFIAVGIFGAIKMAYAFIQHDLPPQIGLILMALNDIINFVIAIIAFVLIKETFKYFLSFRQAIKQSVSKASIILSEFFFFYVILILLFYSLVHVPTYCAIKAIASITTLNVMGIHIEAPKSYEDLGAVAWDAALLGVVAGTCMDCTSYLRTNTTTNNVMLMSLNDPSCELIPRGGMSIKDLMTYNGPTCVSLIIKGTVILILLFLIIITIALLWELLRYIFNKTKALELKVRGRDETEDEEDEYL